MFPIERLDYRLPESLVAAAPADRREDARLLVLDRASGTMTDRTIRDLPELLAANDMLVLNNTRVLPAKLQAHRGSGGRVRGLFIEEIREGNWRVMLEGSRRLKTGEILTFSQPRPVDSASGDVGGPPPGDIHCSLVDRLADGEWVVAVSPAGPAFSILDRIGQPPLPPYIEKRRRDAPVDVDDPARYQTEFASRPGAIAAPTAGLHFSHRMLQDLAAVGVEHAFVTLHVGVGTFKPIQVEDLADHKMHEEWFEMPGATAARLSSREQGRVVAVGTTSVRVLESAVATRSGSKYECHENGTISGVTDIFICPPYRFRVVDALLTNFHLPRSTLLALVMAFAGEELIRDAYAHAVVERYRFFSYGDAMLII